jgi:hypothetical protein
MEFRKETSISGQGIRTEKENTQRFGSPDFMDFYDAVTKNAKVLLDHWYRKRMSLHGGEADWLRKNRAEKCVDG